MARFSSREYEVANRRSPGLHRHRAGLDGGAQHPLLRLQRTAGNRAVTQLLEAAKRGERPSQAGPVVQRVILYNGKQFSAYGQLASDREAMAEVRKIFGNSFGYRERALPWLEDKNNAYDLEGNKLEGVAVEKKEEPKPKADPMLPLADYLRDLDPTFTGSARKHLGERNVPRNLDQVRYLINNARPYQLDLEKRGGEELAYVYYNRTSPGSRADHCKIIINLNQSRVFHVGPGWGGSL